MEIQVTTIVAADDMYEDGMLKEMRKESNKNTNYLQVLEEVRRGWVKKMKTYEGYLRRLYTQREKI